MPYFYRLADNLIPGRHAGYPQICLKTLIYHIDWFSRFVGAISFVSKNLTEIPNTPNTFPEYSIAFLSFVNAVGPVYVVIGFYFGIKHYKSIKDKITEIADTQFSTTKLIGGALFFLLMILVFLWGSYYFSGESTVFPGIFYQSEWRFVLFYTLLWIFNSMSAFLLSATSLVILNRFK